MSDNRPAVRTLRWAIVTLGIAAPGLSLIPFGALWLWQSGWFPHWLVAALATTLAAVLLLSSVLPATPRRAAGGAERGAGESADPAWSPAERAAWDDVLALARSTEPTEITNREAAIALGLRTFEAVARRLHPDRKVPLYQFTVPEGLAVIERVSARLRTAIVDTVPLGDRLTVAQWAVLWRNRRRVEIAEKAYDIWRLVRALNPTSALAAEVRERLQKELVAWTRERVMTRLVALYVEEVGRAAIDLFGGRLRVLPAAAADRIAADVPPIDPPAKPPIRILLLGRSGAGKSSLVNALAAEVQAGVDALPLTADVTPYHLFRDGATAAIVVDTPGLSSDAATRRRLLAEATVADMILWVTAANRPDRAREAEVVSAIKAHFAARPTFKPPAIIPVVTHIDRLRPFTEWQPPYNLTDETSPKARSIAAAISAVARDLGLPEAECVPTALPPGLTPFNIDVLWAAMMARMPQAQATRLLRVLRRAEHTWDWRKIWTQAANGGRIAAKTVLGRAPAGALGDRDGSSD